MIIAEVNGVTHGTVHVPRRDWQKPMSLTQRVALKAKYKLYISGGGSPEMNVDGNASLQTKGPRGP